MPVPVSKHNVIKVNLSTLVSLLTLVAEKMKWTNYFHIRVLCKKQGTISIINGKSSWHFLTEVMTELTWLTFWF